MKKIIWINVIIFSIGVIFFFSSLISLIKIISWKIDSNNTKIQINNIINNINIEDVQDNKKTNFVEQKNKISELNPYWSYIKMNMINVDLSKLKDINSDTKGWIQVVGTNINYPFVQTIDNTYYLTHSFDKSYNTSGWIFLDYRNNSIENTNTIIYAHGRIDKTMFGSLKSTLNNEWLNIENNHVIKISTNMENTLWEVFSVYLIPTTNDYLQVSFKNNIEIKDFFIKLKNRSHYKFNTDIEENDKILTLSTCYNQTDKLVLHAKLIKVEKK